MATGVRVAVQDAGTVPDMRRGIMVGPGAETTWMLSATQRQRLPRPYASQCTDQQLLDGSLNINYTEDGCTEVCVQDQVKDVESNFFNLHNCSKSYNCAQARLFCSTVLTPQHCH